MKNLLIIVFSVIASLSLQAQDAPVSQIEGFLEVYHPVDTTSTYIGLSAGQNQSSLIRRYNTFVGSYAGFSSTAGSDNSFFGYSAGMSNTNGENNAFFGNDAGRQNTTGTDNSFYGSGAGEFNTTGFDNAFFGTNAGRDNTTGRDNSFFGRYAGEGNTTGSINAFFGIEAGEYNTTGNGNSFFGGSAGASNSTGSDNSFFGRNAGDSNSSGSDNAFFGNNAGDSNTTGYSNTFLGSEAGKRNSTGKGNVALGANAGPTSTNSDKNLRLYIEADTTAVAGNDNPLIYGEFDNDYVKINGKGDYASYLRVGTDMEEYPTSGQGLELVYDTSRSLALIQSYNRDESAWGKLYLGSGNVGVGTTNPLHPLHVIGNVQATTFNGSSDQRLKKDITQLNYQHVLDRLKKVPIASWSYIGDNKMHYGPMAQDFYAAFGLGEGNTTIATVDADGVALAAIKALAEENERLLRKNLELENRVHQLENLEERISQLESKL